MLQRALLLLNALDNVARHEKLCIGRASRLVTKDLIMHPSTTVCANWSTRQTFEWQHLLQLLRDDDIARKVFHLVYCNNLKVVHGIKEQACRPVFLKQAPEDITRICGLQCSILFNDEGMLTLSGSGNMPAETLNYTLGAILQIDFNFKVHVQDAENVVQELRQAIFDKHHGMMRPLERQLAALHPETLEETRHLMWDIMCKQDPCTIWLLELLGLPPI